MSQFRWYDYLVIWITSDICAALIMSLLVDESTVLGMLPFIIMFWLSYENLRSSNKNEPQ
jgi:hypothetical protein